MTATLSAWIGVDESGKGDYFGPLVIAAVCVDDETASMLRTSGVRDSKTLSDRTIADLAKEIEGLCRTSVVAIGPARYNELYNKFKNLNRLLGWGHARAIENVLEAGCPASHAISDQFGDERFITSALMEKGRTIRLTQRPRAEEDVAVAAASIMARAEFVKRLDRLSDEAGLTLPKGASNLVDAAAKRLVRAKGKDALTAFAKVHFKTTAKVLAE
ncbi:MAG TPA: ribonuclease HIII [Nitrospiria bacterium]|nr:ribonuclease HIII [Nitrospiria bacterium]